MNVWMKFWVGAITLLTANGAMASAPFTSGLYLIAGTHSKAGSYSGSLLIKSDGSVQRLVEFATPIDGEKIQELWEGTSDGQSLHFEVRPSRAVTSYNSMTLAAKDFAIVPLEIKDQTAQFSLVGDGDYQESYTQVGTDQTPDLFEPMVRQKLDGYGEATSDLLNLGEFFGVNEVIRQYRALPFFDAYRDREEFKKNEVWQYKDFTDLDFYRKNKTGILRLRNLSLNPLSVAETEERRMAFAPTLAEKAALKDQRTVDLHLNDVGILEHALVDQNGNRTRYIPDYDSALWTGMYVWSQYLRYQATHDPVAYANFKKALVGIANLMSISTNPKVFARYIVKSPASEAPTAVGADPRNAGLIQGQGDWKDYKYHPGSNNDMTKGIFLGFMLAHEGLLPEDTELRKRFAELSGRLPEIATISKGGYNKAMGYGIHALWTKSPASLAVFVQETLNIENDLGDMEHASAGFLVGAIEDSSGVHLTAVSTAVQLMLAKALINSNSFPDDRNNIQKVYNEARRQLIDMEHRMAKAHHGYIEVAVYSLLGEAAMLPAAQEGVSILKEIPIGQLPGQIEANFSLQPDWCPSSWPHRPWKALKGPWMINHSKVEDMGELEMGAYGHPIYEGPGWENPYLWNNNYSNPSFKASSDRIDFSADYLWLYWLARSSQLIGPND